MTKRGRWRMQVAKRGRRMLAAAMAALARLRLPGGALLLRGGALLLALGIALRGLRLGRGLHHRRARF